MDKRWKILILLFMARTGLGFQFQVLGSVSETLVEELAFSHTAVGTLIGLFMLAGILIAFPAGLANRFLSDRWLVAAGLALLAFGGWISASGSTFLLIGIGRIVSGAGFVFGTLYFAKMVADWFSGKEMATAMGILVLSWPVGIALGQLVFPWIAMVHGYPLAFYVAAFYCAIAACLVAVCYRPPTETSSGVKPTATLQSKSLFTPQHWKLTLTAASSWGLFNAGYVVYLSYSATVLSEAGFSATQASTMSSIPSWLMIVSAIVVGQLVDRKGNRAPVLYCAMAASALSLSLLATGSAIYFSLVLLGLTGMGAAGVIMSLTGESMPAEARAFGMGIFFTVYFLLGLPAPAIAGWLYDVTGTPSSSMLFSAFLFAMVAVTVWLFGRLQKPN